jgi:hypothetical protein
MFLRLIEIKAVRAQVSLGPAPLECAVEIRIHGSGETRPQCAQTSHFVQMFQACRRAQESETVFRRIHSRRPEPAPAAFEGGTWVTAFDLDRVALAFVI